MVIFHQGRHAIQVAPLVAGREASRQWQLPLYGQGSAGSLAACTDWVLSCIQEGSLRPDVLITDTIAPADPSTAYRWLLEEPAAHLAVVIDWTSESA